MPKLPIEQKGIIERLKTLRTGDSSDIKTEPLNLIPGGRSFPIKTEPLNLAPGERSFPMIGPTLPSAVKTSTPTDQSGLTPSGLFITSEGTIDFQKSLDEIKRKTLDIQAKAKELAVQTQPDTSGFVSSSEPVIQGEIDITQTVSDLTPVPVDGGIDSAQVASDNYLAILDKQSVELERRREAEIKQIESQFAEAKIGLEQEQKKEKGTTAVGLARIGGFLGPSASHTGVLLNLAQTHRAEVTTLEGKKTEAIRQANNAITDKQFDLARLRVEEIKDIEETIHDRKVQFFNQSLDAANEARRQDEFFRKKVEDDLKTFGEIAISDEELEMDPTRASEIDQYFGVKGFTNQYLDVIRTTAEAKASEEKIEAKKNMLDLLEKIPQGQEVQFPDGTIYTGIGKAGDITATLQIDDIGFGRMVSYNKRTGEVNTTTVGQVGKTKDTNGEEEDILFDTIIGNTSVALEATKGEDGYYDPERYLDVRNELKANYPQYLKEMDKTFLNPASELFDQDAIEELRKKGVTAQDRF